MAQDENDVLSKVKERYLRRVAEIDARADRLAASDAARPDDRGSVAEALRAFRGRAMPSRSIH
jgi:1,2-phenylacetyl-CoA epoxidase PaaB subunit